MVQLWGVLRKIAMKYLITPPRELVAMWAGFSARHHSAGSVDYVLDLVTKAAQWGADQELGACCSIALTDPVCGTKHQRSMLVRHMRERRRPKPPSLKQQALDLIDGCTDPEGDYLDDNALSIIRRALESIPDPS